MIGISLIAWPVGIILILNGDFWQGIFVIVAFLIVVANIDTVLRPVLVPKGAYLNPALLMLSVFGGLALMGFIGAPVGGWLADRIGRKNVVVPGAFVIATGATVSAFVDSFETMLPAVLLWGLGNALITPGMSAYAADLATDEGSRGQTLSLARQAGDAAFLVAPVGLGTLAETTDCTTAMCATAVIVLSANLSFALRTREAYTPTWKGFH